MSDKEKKQIPSPKDTWVNPLGKRRVFTRPIFVFGIVLLILVLVGAGYALWHINDNEKSASSADGVKMEQLEYAELRERVSELEFQKKYVAAKELVRYQKYYNNNIETQLLYASLTVNQDECSEAIKTFQNIEKKFKESAEVALNIAECATKVGDKKLAKEYYNKAIALAEKSRDNPVKNADIQLYKQKIKQLEER